MLKSVRTSPSRRNAATFAGSGCLALLAIPFAAAGLFCLGPGLFSCWQVQGVRSWEQTEGQIDTFAQTLLARKGA